MSLAESERTAQPVTLFWRPGCGFCARLIYQLDEEGVVYDRRNIWDDPDAAALVRSVARGYETVPTVVIGDEVYVNPSPHLVIDLVRGTDG